MYDRISCIFLIENCYFCHLGISIKASIFMNRNLMNVKHIFRNINSNYLKEAFEKLHLLFTFCHIYVLKDIKCFFEKNKLAKESKITIKVRNYIYLFPHLTKHWKLICILFNVNKIWILYLHWNFVFVFFSYSLSCAAANNQSLIFLQNSFLFCHGSQTII